ncbi:hypothetical protein B0T21DRAFT_441985 [Apiosordaria backusii]|uniref:Uncharacterized protein n=1 Tax=Apiosordaria backusii TaxID=314023 RepID=A0AA40EFC6_9PEZI|nr:hypothetical protein B0T21DRAFT_441985 [Apiosordaria backusii]
MPSSKTAKKKQRQKKAAAEKNQVIPEMTEEELTSMISGLEPTAYEKTLVDAARKHGDVADMIITRHDSLLKIRVHEEILVVDFAKMAKAINRSLNAKYYELLESTTAENRTIQVRKYAKTLVNNINGALNYMTAQITEDSLFSTKFAALDSVRSVLESILRGPKPLQDNMSRFPAFQKWDVKLMVVLKHFKPAEMCKIRCSGYRCDEHDTPTQVQSAEVPDATEHEVAIREKNLPAPSQTEVSSSQIKASSSQNPSLEDDLTQSFETTSSSEPLRKEPPRPKLTKEEITNMISPLFPTVLNEVMISTALAHPSVIPAIKVAYEAKVATESSRTKAWDTLCLVMNTGLNDYYRLYIRSGISVARYADQSATYIDDALTQVYTDFRALHKPLYSTKIAALEGIRKILEEVLRCPDELRDALCWHVEVETTNDWAHNLVRILECFEDEEIYKLVKGKTDEPNDFWSNRGVPALLELARKVKGPDCHPWRKEFFRDSLLEVSSLLWKAVTKCVDPLMVEDDYEQGFPVECTCGFFEDSDEDGDSGCRCYSCEGIDDIDDEDLELYSLMPLA